MKNIFFFLLLFVSVSYGQTTIHSDFLKQFHQLKLNDKYELKSFLQPSYLMADFDGDGITDIAALIIDKKTNKKGVLLIQGGSK